MQSRSGAAPLWLGGGTRTCEPMSHDVACVRAEHAAKVAQAGGTRVPHTGNVHPQPALGLQTSGTDVEQFASIANQSLMKVCRIWHMKSGKPEGAAITILDRSLLLLVVSWAA
jgi:hypothetical protein